MVGENLFRFIHTADTHLGIDQPKRKARENIWYRSYDFKNNFSLILKEAIRPDVDFLIHAGDLYDRSKPPATVVKETKTELFNLHKPVFLLPGNHERSLLKKSLLDSFSKIHIFNRPETVEHEINGFRIGITGVPFIRDGFTKKFSSLLNKTGHDEKRYDYKILLLHQLLEGATVGIQNYTFRTTNPNVLPLSMIPGSFDYIALGHVHRYQRLFPPHLKNVPVIYPGSIERTALAEVNEEKGYLLVDVSLRMENPSFKTVLKFVKLPTRSMYHYRIDMDEKTVFDTREIISQVEDKLQSIEKDSIVYIKITGPNIKKFWTLLGEQKKNWMQKHGLKKFTIKISDTNDITG